MLAGEKSYIDRPFRLLLPRPALLPLILQQQRIDIPLCRLQHAPELRHPVPIGVLGVHRVEHIIGHAHDQGVDLEPIIQPLVLLFIKGPDFFVLDRLELRDGLAVLFQLAAVDAIFQLALELGVKLIMDGGVYNILEARFPARGADGSFEVIGSGVFRGLAVQ